MQRVKLSKNEKSVLRLLSNGANSCPPSFPKDKFNDGAEDLEARRFAKCGRIEGGDVEHIRITQRGRQYISDYPTLRNPLNWGLIISILTLIATIVGWFANPIMSALGIK